MILCKCALLLKCNVCQIYSNKLFIISHLLTVYIYIYIYIYIYLHIYIVNCMTNNNYDNS